MFPRLSVIIPVYNVEPYIEECLGSIAEQEFRDLEVILVNDGSTDRSAVIAQRFVAEDPRFRLVHQPNRGLGAARNAGIRRASPGAEYLAFADSDDVLPPTAYSSLVESLDASGSDIAGGNVYRFDSQRSFQFEKHAQDFRRVRMRTTVLETPGLLMDRTVWNKVYRRTFWDQHDLLFPEGMLYEDPVVTVPLYCLAEAIDIVPEIVYYWRIREGGIPSITQQRTASAMLDRFTSIDLVRSFLREHVQASHDGLRCYDWNLLMEEIPLFFDEILEADDKYRLAFAKKAAGLLEEIPSRLREKVPLPLHDVYRAIMDGPADDLAALISMIALDPDWRRRLAMSNTSVSNASAPPPTPLNRRAAE